MTTKMPRMGKFVEEEDEEERSLTIKKIVWWGENLQNKILLVNEFFQVVGGDCDV